ncbi:MAG: hypothetical protein AAGJ54_09375 [Planctomycetota bacterium]
MGTFPTTAVAPTSDDATPAVPRLLTQSKLAGWLEVSDRHVRKLMADGLPTVWVGPRSPRFEPERVLAWLRDRGEGEG